MKKKDYLSILIIIFILASFVGVLYEGLLRFIFRGYLSLTSGTLYGLFNPVYGLGAVLFVLVLEKDFKERPWWANFLFSTLLGGILEFTYSLFLEKIFLVEAWNYTGYLTNIGGRTTILYALFWGLCGIFTIKYFYPFIKMLYFKCNRTLRYSILPIVEIIFVFNLVLSFSVLYKSNYYLNHHSFIDVLYREAYPESVIKKKMPYYSKLKN